MSKLRLAAMEGNANRVAEILQSDISHLYRTSVPDAPPPEMDQETDRAEALHLAAARGHSAVVKALIQAGAPINQIFPGGTALHAAVMSNDAEVVEILLQAGADPDLSDRCLDARQQGWTALMYAACYGRTVIAERLLKAGAQTNLKDRDGQTPLMIAANAGHTAVALLLLEAGAKLTDQDHYGNTALTCALAHDSHHSHDNSHDDGQAKELALSLAQQTQLAPQSQPVITETIGSPTAIAKSPLWSWESVLSGEGHSPSPSAAIAQTP